jgi:hypothetical protein
MTMRNRLRSAELTCPRWRELSLVTDLAQQESSFHGSLRECAQDLADDETPSWPNTFTSRPRPRPRPVEPKPASPPFLLRAWSWLRSKYAVTAPKKRLKVAEMVNLGEKRFVAVVNVEGREFLIGGGSAGVSLMTQLGAARDPAEALRREFTVQRGSE